jgi:hypothetical protein
MRSYAYLLSAILNIAKQERGAVRNHFEDGWGIDRVAGKGERLGHAFGDECRLLGIKGVVAHVWSPKNLCR